MARLIVTPQAQQDILVAAEWYEGQASGLVQAFLNQLRYVRNRLVKTPLIYQERVASLRLVRLRRFPYCVYFRADDDLIVIVAVLHERRDPLALQARL
ncbi:type II toxin-antitoxin system RelE/ParE family toxin [Niveispirillum irakense]|uniref:type II toxin-antitoxin system RelE/ParE family toxin n=1 Tax=Niveispirillum irakense TaxID=34011 RepID=UPI0004267F46|nr:type II toxin-antitoxin system RelE/ParE family toxin [Niveispirillum irakense]